MRVLLVLLMCMGLMPVMGFAQENNVSNAVYKHNTAFFGNFEQISSKLNNLVYKHTKDEYSQVTDDQKITQALNLMVGTIGEYSRKAILGNNASGGPMKIKFYDLSQISPNYLHYDALGWKNGKQLYIYINTKHQNAPVEALASLLSHEAMHQDELNSLNEETYAWTMEAAMWLQMKKLNPELNKLAYEHPLVKRENTIGRMFKNANYTTKLVRQEVESNPGYAGLPKRSPSFEDDN